MPDSECRYNESQGLTPDMLCAGGFQGEGHCKVIINYIFLKQNFNQKWKKKLNISWSNFVGKLCKFEKEKIHTVDFLNSSPQHPIVLL